MTITVTEFKAKCLSMLRELERSEVPLEISKQGRVRFRIITVKEPSVPPWARLRGKGRLLAGPNESVLSSQDFDATQ